MKINYEIEINDKYIEFVKENENKIKSGINRYIKSFIRKNYIVKDVMMIELFNFINDVLVTKNEVFFTFQTKHDSCEILKNSYKYCVRLTDHNTIYIYDNDTIKFIITKIDNIYNYDSFIVDDDYISECIKEGELFLQGYHERWRNKRS